MENGICVDCNEAEYVVWTGELCLFCEYINSSRFPPVVDITSPAPCPPSILHYSKANPGRGMAPPTGICRIRTLYLYIAGEAAAGKMRHSTV